MQIQATDGIHKGLIPMLLEKADFSSGIDVISLFSLYSLTTQTKYKNYIIGVSPSSDTIFKQQASIDTRVLDALDEGLRAIDNSIDNFGKVKYALDKFFYDITEKGVLIYTYQKQYLISSSRLGKILNISRPTIHRYKELGLESVEGVGHSSYPLHNTFYWKDGIWASRIQSLYQSFKLRNQTNLEIIAEIEKEVEAFKKKYGGTFDEVFGKVTDPYQTPQVDDYYTWRDLLEDLKNLHD